MNKWEKAKDTATNGLAILGVLFVIAAILIVTPMLLLIFVFVFS